MAATWDTVRNLPGFIVAIIAVVGTLISSAVWITGYFATQKNVDFVECVSTEASESLSGQISAIVYYDAYTRNKARLIELKTQLANDPGNATVLSDIDEAEKQKELMWNKRLQELAKSESANGRRDICVRNYRNPSAN